MMKSNMTSFVLGSGKSLLELSDREIESINNSPFSLCFNKYILFHELIGIRPTHYLLADSGKKAIFTFMRLEEKLKTLNNISLIFSEDLIRVARLACGNNYVNSILDNNPCKIIKRYHWLEGGKWARNMSEPIFHFRGSLSGCINLATILNTAQDINLVGVDLNDHDYFFSSIFASDPIKWAPLMNRLTPESELHETVVQYGGAPGLDYAMPFIRRKVQELGMNLYCSNKNSLLVSKNILEYRKIY